MTNYLLRYGEIFLKGKNRSFFEKKLIHNLKCYLKNQQVEGKITRLRNRLYAETSRAMDWKYVFGLTNYSPCVKIPANYMVIQNEVERMIQDYTPKTTFRITTNVMDPKYGMSKQEMNEKLGAFVVQQTKARVNLKNYEEEIGIEVLQGHAYLYNKMIPCPGGLPVGVEGSALLWVEDENSLLAGILAMKRGCAVFPVAQDKKDLTLLEKYAYGTKPTLKLLREVDLHEFIQHYEIQALVVGDTLTKIKEYPEISLPVLRPLVGYTKERVQEEQRKYV